MEAKDIVKKHSKLILYNETKGLSAVEQKLFIYCIAKAVRANDIDTFHNISIREFTGKKNPSIYDYRKAKKALFALQQMKPLYIELDGKFKSIVIFPTLQGDARSIDSDEDIDKIELSYKLNDELKPLIVNLKEAYTEYLYSTVSKLKSSFAIRLYEILLQQAKFNRPYSVTVENLKVKFGIQDVKTYKTYSQFKRAVIEKSIKEINEGTDISGYYEEEKQGRKVYKLTFHFRLDSTPLKVKSLDEILTAEELLVYNALPDEKTKKTYLKQIGKELNTSNNTKDVQINEKEATLNSTPKEKTNKTSKKKKVEASFDISKLKALELYAEKITNEDIDPSFKSKLYTVIEKYVEKMLSFDQFKDKRHAVNSINKSLVSLLENFKDKFDIKEIIRVINTGAMTGELYLSNLIQEKQFYKPVQTSIDYKPEPKVSPKQEDKTTSAPSPIDFIKQQLQIETADAERILYKYKMKCNREGVQPSGGGLMEFLGKMKSKK